MEITWKLPIICLSYLANSLKTSRGYTILDHFHTICAHFERIQSDRANTFVPCIVLMYRVICLCVYLFLYRTFDPSSLLHRCRAFYLQIALKSLANWRAFAPSNRHCAPISKERQTRLKFSSRLTSAFIPTSQHRQPTRTRSDSRF